VANIGTTNVPAISWGPNGPQAPSGPAILAGIQTDYDVAFNVTFNWQGSTPQGQLAASQAAAVNYSNQAVIYYASQFDPATSTGRMQDAIGHIFPGPQFNRLPAEPTTLQIACNGAGAAIPAGPTTFGLVIDPSGNLYQCTQAGTLPVGGGTITLTFAAITPGPIAVPATVQIYQSIPGWDSATVVSGVEGQNVETSQQFELRRQQSVAANSVNANTSILGAVLEVPGVLDAYVIDNPSNSPLTIGGFTLIANSVYVAVTGGAATDVAQAIWSKKPPGIPMNGNTTEPVTDQNPAYSPPFPSYQISFEIPASLPIYYSINIANSSLIPANATTQIQNAIIAAFNGSGGGAVFTGSISGNILTVTSVASGTIVVGQSLAGANVVPGTTVTALGTGMGNAGTYTVSLNQNTPSTTITAAPFTNNPSPPRARIGSVIYGSQYAAVVAALGSWAAVRTCQVGSANTAGAVVVGSISGTTLSINHVTSGSLVVGDWITGQDSVNSISVGTRITALGSGSGGTGTYTVSNPQTIAGASFTASGTGTNLTASSVTGIIGIGDVIAGSGIPTGTTILSQTSGTVGGSGVYVTSVSTTASGTVTASVSITAVPANQNLVVVGIAQEPTIAPPNIVVTYT
jgi:hypothetical protein